MQTTEFIWHNGQLVPWNEAKIHVLTHSLHYGSGLFEGIRAYATKKGAAIFRLHDHFTRLFESAPIINMKIPYTQEQLEQATQELVARNKINQCYIRPICYFGYGKMGVDPTGCPVGVSIACWPWDSYVAQYSFDVQTSRYIRLPRNVTVADAKISGNYINSILGILNKDPKYHEALFLDSNGFIAEGPSENFFMVKDNILYTPKLGCILSGITRDTVIQLAKKLGLAVIEKDISLEEAYSATEAFFTGTAAEVAPIRSIDDHLLNEGKKGVITQQILDGYHNIVYGRNPEFEHYLTYVQP